MNFTGMLQEKFKINLNEQQEKAVMHKDGPALVLSGPGSGKTTVIISRLANMILNEKVNPEQILSLTFNRGAAIEMETRFNAIYGKLVQPKIKFSTLHSFCYSILRDYSRMKGSSLMLIEGTESMRNKRNIVKEIYRHVNNAVISDDELETLYNELGYIKNKMIKDIDGKQFSTKNIEQVFNNYETLKRQNNMIDFDDMLTYAFSILSREEKIRSAYCKKYRYIQVDEGQDLSKVQFEIIRLLAGTGRNVFVVADDDQSIYGFRGAEPDYIVDFRKIFPGAAFYYLEKNYRSTRNIVDISSNIIMLNKKRHKKNHKTDNSPKHDPEIAVLKDEFEQLEYIRKTVKKLIAENKSIAVLYRSNLSSLLVADLFDRSGIPFRVKDSRLNFFSHWLVLDIAAFFKFALDQWDEESFQRIYYKMNRFLSKEMMEYACSLKENTSILDRMLKYGELKDFQRNRIRELKGEFTGLAKLSPSQALKYIEISFNYLESVKEYCDKCGYSFSYIMNLYTIVRILAENCKTLNDFLIRLDKLKDLIKNSEGGRNRSAVTLSTVHSSKGLEYDSVLLIDLYDGEFPGKQSLEEAKKDKDKGDESSLLEEERRLFYVGITRAREDLYLIYPETKNSIPVDKSMFIQEVRDYLERKAIGKIHVGCTVNHVVYGRGIISVIQLGGAGASTSIRVDFNGNTRLLDLRVCLEKGIINIVE